MSLVAQIPINPNGSRVRYPVKRFSAPFGAGTYNFAQVGNTDVLLYKLSASSVYCMERINFYANVSEADWLEGMGAEATFPAFTVRFQHSPDVSIWPEPVRCVNYIDNEEQLVFFRTTRQDDNLLITFTGLVNQVAGMVGTDPLLAQVNFTMYEITDQPWIEKFILAKGH